MILRQMHRHELDQVLDWAAAEGWNPGHDDAAAFYTTDPEGFFVAEVDGRPVAAISVVNHSEDHAFLGLYLCLPEYRGQGVGYALWSHALAHAGERTVGLDGVPAQQENYRRSGFVHAGETRRYAGRVPGQSHPDIRSVRGEEIPVLIALETAANGYPKERFLKAWLTDTPGRRTLVHVTDGQPDGFVTLRNCREGAKIGPLVAPDLATAQALLHAAAEQTKNGQVILDVPGHLQDLAQYCEALGMGCAFHTARMYRGPAPRRGPATYTVATLELG